MTERAVSHPATDSGFILLDALMALAVLGAATALALQTVGNNAARVRIDDEHELLAVAARSTLVTLRQGGDPTVRTSPDLEVTVHRQSLPEATGLDQIEVMARSRHAPHRTFSLFSLARIADHDRAR